MNRKPQIMIFTLNLQQHILHKLTLIILMNQNVRRIWPYKRVMIVQARLRKIKFAVAVVIQHEANYFFIHCI